MSNMSYCRFQNTLQDLMDCQGALEETHGRGLSPEEARAASRLIEACRAIAEEWPDGTVLPGDVILLRRVLEEGPTIDLDGGRDLASAHRLEDAGLLTRTPDCRTQVTITEGGVTELETDDADED